MQNLGLVGRKFFSGSGPKFRVFRPVNACQGSAMEYYFYSYIDFGVDSSSRFRARTNRQTDRHTQTDATECPNHAVGNRWRG